MNPKHHAENQRIKRQYLAWLQGARHLSEQTLDAVSQAIARFEIYNRHKHFKAFHFEQARGFVAHLTEQRNQRSGERLSKATMYATLAHLREFFRWLSGRPGFKCVAYADAEYFSMSGNDTRIAKAQREVRGPTLEQIRHVIMTMPVETVIERRNRALIATTLLTAARDGALASLKLKHVDLARGCLYQDAREVKTKFRKSFTTFFTPFLAPERLILTEWVEYLRRTELWGNDDPLFPATRVGLDADRHFEAAGLSREHWSNATPIRTIFRGAFEAAGLDYANPHSFRHTIARLGLEVCPEPKALKAWSQNFFGHASVLTTLCSYGTLDTATQGDIIGSLGEPGSRDDSDLRQALQALLCGRM